MIPEISVLTSVYNCESYLDNFLNSILNQTFKNFELILIDDGSVDNSIKIIEKFTDNRIKLYRFNKNQGFTKALNFGIDKCQGKYIARADPDDIYEPDRLEKQKKVLDTNNNISVVGSQIEYFPNDHLASLGQRYISKKKYFEDQLNSILTINEIKEKMYMFWCITHSVMMIRADLLAKFRYDESFEIAEDYKLLYDLNKAGYKMLNIEEKLGKIRIHKDSTSILKKDKLFDALFRIKYEELKALFKKTVYIWGAGSFGIGIQKEAEKHGFEIIGFIDNSNEKIGTKIEGLEIFPPSFLKDRQVGVISASDPGRFEIVEYLKDIGYIHLKDFIVF